MFPFTAVLLTTLCGCFILQVHGELAEMTGSEEASLQTAVDKSDLEAFQKLMRRFSRPGLPHSLTGRSLNVKTLQQLFNPVHTGAASADALPDQQQLTQQRGNNAMSDLSEIPAFRKARIPAPFPYIPTAGPITNPARQSNRNIPVDVSIFENNPDALESFVHDSAIQHQSPRQGNRDIPPDFPSPAGDKLDFQRSPLGNEELLLNAREVTQSPNTPRPKPWLMLEAK